MMSVHTIDRFPMPAEMPTLRYIEPEEFCRLVVSNRTLQRCDDPRSGLRGLEDLATGECYVVEDLRLANFLANRRPR